MNEKSLAALVTMHFFQTASLNDHLVYGLFRPSTWETNQ